MQIVIVKENERLALETLISKIGENTIMTKEKKARESNERAKEKIVEEFSALPLERKLANLMRMEAVAIGETIEFVVNSGVKVLEDVGGAMSDFSKRIESEIRNATETNTAPKSADPKTPKTSRPGKKRSPDSQAKK